MQILRDKCVKSIRMGHLINYKQKSNSRLFETFRISTVMAVRRNPFFLNEKSIQKKNRRYRLFANKMCPLSVYFPKFGCCDS
jgi:hypothetical protein